MWISVENYLPISGQLVEVFRDSPTDAETMIYREGAFIDLYSNVWEVGAITYWRPQKPVN